MNKERVGELMCVFHETMAMAMGLDYRMGDSNASFFCLIFFIRRSSLHINVQERLSCLGIRNPTVDEFMGLSLPFLFFFTFSSLSFEIFFLFFSLFHYLILYAVICSHIPPFSSCPCFFFLFFHVFFTIYPFLFTFRRVIFLVKGGPLHLAWDGL